MSKIVMYNGETAKRTTAKIHNYGLFLTVIQKFDDLAESDAIQLNREEASELYKFLKEVLNAEV